MYPDAVLRSNGLLLIIYLPSKACLRICSWRSRWHTELLLHLYEQLQSSLGCASSWALFVGLRCQGFSSALPAPASLLLLSSLLLCRWSLEFQFLEHIESKGLKGSEKRRAWSKEILGQYRPCFLLEPGGGGEVWIYESAFPSSHRLSFCPWSFSWDDTYRAPTGRHTRVSLTSNSWKLLPDSACRLSVNLGLWGQTFKSFLSLYSSC